MHFRLRVLLRRAGVYEPLWCWKIRRADRSPAAGTRAWIEYYRPFLAPDGLCFDIGAHIGQQTVVFVSLGQRVIAVEPRAEAARQLRCRFRDRNVEVREMAVDVRSGSRTLHVNPDHHELSSLIDGWSQKVGEMTGIPTGSTTPVTVRTTTLEDLIMQHGVPQLLKIDVEGMESELLFGLHTPIPHVVFEVMVERESSLRECVALLESNARYLYRIADPFSAPYPWLPADEIVEWILALPEEERTILDLHARRM